MLPDMEREDGENGGHCLIIISSSATSKQYFSLALRSAPCAYLFDVAALRLRRIYILFNAKHGISRVDEAMLQSLDEKCRDAKFTLQAIVTKLDTVPPGDAAKVVARMRTQVFEAAPTCLPVILTSANMQPPFGIEEVRKSVAEACGLI
jgi:GTP-binding protein EngB required for normal cell division